MLFLVYCSFFNNSKTSDFIKVAEAVQEECQQGSCPALPKAWQSTDCVSDERLISDWPIGKRLCAAYHSNSTSLGLYYYVTDEQRFLISNHYYTDSTLEARGGKQSPLIVTRFIKGSSEQVYPEN